MSKHGKVYTGTGRNDPRRLSRQDRAVKISVSLIGRWQLKEDRAVMTGAPG